MKARDSKCNQLCIFTHQLILPRTVHDIIPRSLALISLPILKKKSVSQAVTLVFMKCDYQLHVLLFSPYFRLWAEPVDILQSPGLIALRLQLVVSF